MINIRVLSAVIAIPILLCFVYIGGTVFTLGVLALTAIALFEYIGAYKNSQYKIILWVSVIGYLLNVYIIFSKNNGLILPLIYLIVLISMATPIFSKGYNVISSALTISGHIYIVNFFSVLIFIMQTGNGHRLIWLVFIIAWFCDTFAYYSGRLFGKRKLCPNVSPKKTIEGAIGGVIGSVVGVILWGYFNRNINFSWAYLISLGIIASIISQIGDLSASLIKRYVGVKDYGKIMPGHGGILDRFDSILFVAPIVYYYIVLLLR